MSRSLRDMATGAGLALAGVAAFHGIRSPQARVARMAGSSIAAPDAAGWVTDFLNAAYYRRPPNERELADLRLAFGIVTTLWHRRGGKRLRAWDVAPVHRALGRHRFLRPRRGTLDHASLLHGASALLGDWFPAAWEDPARRGWGIAFETPADKAAYRPEMRQQRAALGAPTPPVAPGRDQIWHTYRPVEVPAPEPVIDALSRVETWPDYASEVGRFTPVRSGGLAGQTFEIEVVAFPLAQVPLFTRGYVTITRLVSADDRAALDAYVAELEDGLARFGRDEPPAVPSGGEAILAFDLTTHEGHFMGRARNRLLLFAHEGRTYLRAAGTWDPMPWALEQGYRRAGEVAQHAFWGMGREEESMLHQIAKAVGA